MSDRAASRIVTVDGPAGSGKSTLGSHIARALQLPFVDTGLFYRAVTDMASRLHLGADQRDALSTLAARAAIAVGTDPAHQPDVRVDGAQVATDALHDPARASLLAAVSATEGVRLALLPKQRALATRGAVAVGRDCGTVVFPGAPLKIYLDADASLRATRRASQLRAHGTTIDVAVLDREVRGRDVTDTSRQSAPLRPAADARIIDTGTVGIDEMVDRALRWCRDLGLIA